MKKTLKIVMVIIILLILISITYKVQAINISNYKITSNTVSSNGMTKIGKILGVIQVIGSIVSVGALVVLGIKYMFSSIEEKAQEKTSFTIYIIGAILVFAISNISQIIYTWTTSAINK